jgi:Mg2+/Co2+ transporter CorC
VLYAKDLLKCFRDNRTEAPLRDAAAPGLLHPGQQKDQHALARNAAAAHTSRDHRRRVRRHRRLVTFEDMLEEIVGEIQDEYDIHEEAHYQPIGEHAYLVNSRLDIDSLADLLDIDLAEEDGDTVGGLIYSHLGHVPEQGEVLELEGWRFTVLSVDGRRINQVRVERILPPPVVEDAPAPSRVPNQKSVLNPSSVTNQP